MFAVSNLSDSLYAKKIILDLQKYCNFLQSCLAKAIDNSCTISWLNEGQGVIGLEI